MLVNACQCLMMIFNSCPFLSIFNSCPLLSIVVHCCPFLSIIIHSCPFLSILVHSCIFLSILVNYQLENLMSQSIKGDTFEQDSFTPMTMLEATYLCYTSIWEIQETSWMTEAWRAYFPTVLTKENGEMSSYSSSLPSVSSVFTENNVKCNDFLVYICDMFSTAVLHRWHFLNAISEVPEIAVKTGTNNSEKGWWSNFDEKKVAKWVPIHHLCLQRYQ